MKKTHEDALLDAMRRALPSDLFLIELLEVSLCNPPETHQIWTGCAMPAGDLSAVDHTGWSLSCAWL